MRLSRICAKTMSAVDMSNSCKLAPITLDQTASDPRLWL